MPTVKFALLLLIMLLTALLGDLILLPAILAGPAGILFRMGKRLKSPEDSDDEDYVDGSIGGDPDKDQLEHPLKMVRRQ